MKTATPQPTSTRPLTAPAHRTQRQRARARAGGADVARQHGIDLRGERVAAEIEEEKHEHAEEQRHRVPREQHDENAPALEIRAEEGMEVVVQRARRADRLVPLAHGRVADAGQAGKPARRRQAGIFARRPEAQQMGQLVQAAIKEIPERNQQEQDNRAGQQDGAQHLPARCEAAAQPLVQRPGGDGDQAGPDNRHQQLAQQPGADGEEHEHGNGANGLRLQDPSRARSVREGGGALLARADRRFSSAAWTRRRQRALQPKKAFARPPRSGRTARLRGAPAPC